MNKPPFPISKSDNEIGYLSALELSAAFRTRGLSPLEVTEVTLRRIERINPAINAFVTVVADCALAAARKSERRFATGAISGPLDGVPVGIKDRSPTKGIRTTNGSRVFANHVPEEDAPIVERLLNS